MAALPAVFRLEWNAFDDWVWASLLDLSELAPLAACAVVVIAYKTYRQRPRAGQRAISQKAVADNQGAWWSRAQWAVDASFDENPQRRLAGTIALIEMQDSELGTTADQRLLRAVADAMQREAEGEANTQSPDPAVESGLVDPEAELRENEGNKGGPDTDERNQE